MARTRLFDSATSSWDTGGVGDHLMRLFSRKRRTIIAAELAPAFDVRLTLRRGDKIVRRNPDGTIAVTRITEVTRDATEILQSEVRTSLSSARRR